MKKIESTEEFYSLIESKELTLVYFYTKWCPDCFMVKPFLPRLVKEYPQLKFLKMNRDADIELSRHLQIYGIPSFIIFNNGEEKGRFVSKLRKSYIEVKSFIDKTLSPEW